ncbi:hypothetical protein CR513_20185, partial [Mucuna pruriens]
MPSYLKLFFFTVTFSGDVFRRRTPAIFSGDVEFPTKQRSTKKITTAAVGGSGAPVQSVGSSNALFKPTSKNIDIV